MTKRSLRPKTRLLATCLGDCVHVAGVRRFLALADEAGYETRFLGAARPVEAIVEAAEQCKPGILALSYRLTPAALERMLEALLPRLRVQLDAGLRLIFGGTGANCSVAEQTGAFEAVFGGSSGDADCRAYLQGRDTRAEGSVLPDTLVDRIRAKAPLPLIRHHFGQPTVEQTVQGAREIAEAQAIDVLSLGPDQNAQASFFRPDEMDPAQDGAGGVPVRSEDDLRLIYAATRTGNRPLVRCYSGTRDLLRMADMLQRTISNAWAAIPLSWYNVLDGRSGRTVRDAMAEAQAAIGWHARHGIPVEVNESHQWSLRSAPDSVAVATFFLAAYNANQLGVRDYIGQMMFNTPAGTAPDMDLGKMLAKLELVSELEDDGFTVWRETRTGLASLPAGQHRAAGHMCGSIALQLAVRPHILHVVAYSEASHAAAAADVIGSTRMAAGVIATLLPGLPDMASDRRVAARRDELLSEARLLLGAIRELAPAGVEDPWSDPETLARAIECGLLDAPDLAGNPYARGKVRTAIVDGACRAVDGRGRPLTEARRVAESLNAARGRSLRSDLGRGRGPGAAPAGKHISLPEPSRPAVRRRLAHPSRPSATKRRPQDDRKSCGAQDSGSVQTRTQR